MTAIMKVGYRADETSQVYGKIRTPPRSDLFTLGGEASPVASVEGSIDG